MKNSHNLKYGDIIICKRNRFNNYFIKGRQYKIKQGFDQSYINEIYMNQIKPFIGSSVKYVRDSEFTIYFKSLKQIRKEKLKNLI